MENDAKTFKPYTADSPLKERNNLTPRLYSGDEKRPLSAIETFDHSQSSMRRASRTFDKRRLSFSSKSSKPKVNIPPEDLKDKFDFTTYGAKELAVMFIINTEANHITKRRVI